MIALLSTAPAAAGFVLDVSFDGLGCALFSRDRAHRYALTREWGPELLGPTRPLLLIGVGLNPSKAGASPSKTAAQDGDLTITKMMGFGSRIGATAFLMLNMFGLVSTDPKGMETAADSCRARLRRGGHARPSSISSDRNDAGEDRCRVGLAPDGDAAANLRGDGAPSRARVLSWDHCERRIAAPVSPGLRNAARAVEGSP